ncbi:MAG TPA: hypothetical protein VII98_01135 [Solirubrobacteraceae bacterium]
MARLVVLAAVLATLVVPASASAAASFAGTPGMSPAQSTNISPTTTSLGFRVSIPCLGQLMQVVVANQSTTGADGLLIPGAQVDAFTLTETTPGVYEGTTSATWLQTPGSYFWQGVAPNAKCDGTSGGDGGPALVYATQVVGVVVGAPTTGSGTDSTPVDVQDNSEILTLAQAKSSLTSVIRKGTRRTGRRVFGRCTRRGSGSILVVFCTTRWTDGKQWTYNGTIRQALNDDGTISGRFDGRRASLACIMQTARKIDERRCFKKFHFTAEV